MNPFHHILSSKTHDVEDFRVRTSPTRKERLHRSVRVRNAESGWTCSRCGFSYCGCWR